jgi:hypothetical protein
MIVETSYMSRVSVHYKIPLLLKMHVFCMEPILYVIYHYYNVNM